MALNGKELLLNALPLGIVQIYRKRFSKSETVRNLYRYEKVLRRVERRREVEVSFLGTSILVPDFASFFSAYRELFVNEILKFQTKSQSPVIVDLGSNIGISVAYLKSCYPRAKIHAMEADPAIFAYLVTNLKRLGYHDVEISNMAAWDEDGELQFLPDGADGGRIENGASITGSIRVKTVNIGRFLESFEAVELLKVDVEGAEGAILAASESHLRKIERVFIEYHSEPGKKQDLDDILSVLVRNGFRINIRSEYCKAFPFVSGLEKVRYDNQLDIFAYR